jgi:hypothetical protein
MMTVKKDLTVHRRVRIAMSVLPSPQRDAINRVIQSSRYFSDYTSDSARVKRIEASGEQLYILRITPQLRLVYTETGDAIQILDLVERATIDNFSGKRARKRMDRTQNGESGPIERKSKAGKPRDLVEK